MKIIETPHHPIKMWTDYVEVDAEAKHQLLNLASLPFIYKHIAVMPDVHVGKGATVGTVIATVGHLIPAAVGVDIGCGMMGVKLPFKIDQIQDLPKLRHSIERSVPVGENYHHQPLSFLENINHLIRSDINTKAWLQLGTLGSGNHFIEISKDENEAVWVIVHSGSRGIGHQLATKHIKKAQEMMGKTLSNLPDPDLAYFKEGTEAFDDYLKDLMWAQEYASYNREAMMDLILKDVSYHLFHEKRDLMRKALIVINSHHNYSRIENHFGQDIWITRKGAVSAQVDEYGIIPGSMGAKSFIVRGKGNPESFCSCAHGAGRRMSRAQAKSTYTVEDLEFQTAGIECRKDQRVVDEIPSAYKNIDDVMRSQADLVSIAFTLKQVICVKG